MSTTKAESLSVRDLTVRYRVPGMFGTRSVNAVENVSLDIEPGQVVGLVGESGCGKSSIARAIVGLTEPAAGEVLLGGTSLGRRRTRAQRHAVQMIFQNPRASLDPRRTVRDALDEALAIAPRPERPAGDGELNRLLESVALSGALLDRLPSQLSGGQCQRVAIARALALRPRFLLADEATAALDATVAAGTVALFRSLADEFGLGVLLITHDLHTVEWIADEVAVMYLGQLVEHGPVATVLDQPGHPYTACLLDARPTLELQRTRRFTLRGDVLDSADAGCRFASRCPVVTDLCRSTPPALTAGEHALACHHRLDRPGPATPDQKERHAHRVPGA
jgi:oligopeptide/dipeptide ABC transporter ATP-binding protein